MQACQLTTQSPSQVYEVYHSTLQSHKVYKIYITNLDALFELGYGCCLFCTIVIDTGNFFNRALAQPVFLSNFVRGGDYIQKWFMQKSQSNHSPVPQTQIIIRQAMYQFQRQRLRPFRDRRLFLRLCRLAFLMPQPVSRAISTKSSLRSSIFLSLYI